MQHTQSLHNSDLSRITINNFFYGEQFEVVHTYSKGRQPTNYETAEEQSRDQANNDKLLRELMHVDEERRSARFHCVIVLLQHAEDPVPFVAHGTWEGTILKEPAGQGGFGHDPLFFAPVHHLSAAQMVPELKNRISHREEGGGDGRRKR